MLIARERVDTLLLKLEKRFDPNQLRDIIGRWARAGAAGVGRLLGRPRVKVASEVDIRAAFKRIDQPRHRDPATGQPFFGESLPTFWNKTVAQTGVTPQEIADGVLGPLKGKVGQPDLLYLPAMGQFPASFNVSAATDAGVHINRKFDFLRKRVEHAVFELPDGEQRQSTGKLVLAAQMALYKKLGLKEIRLGTEDVGSYAWARYGFLPKGEHWKEEVRIRLRTTPVSDAVKLSIAKILNSKDPRAMWAISDQKTLLPNGDTLGFHLLYKTNWGGGLSLDDRVAMRRFYNYVGQAAKLQKAAAQPGKKGGVFDHNSEAFHREILDEGEEDMAGRDVARDIGLTEEELKELYGEDLEKYDPNQPRDARGRWSDSGAAPVPTLTQPLAGPRLDKLTQHIKSTAIKVMPEKPAEAAKDAAATLISLALLQYNDSTMDERALTMALRNLSTTLKVSQGQARETVKKTITHLLTPPPMLYKAEDEPLLDRARMMQLLELLDRLPLDEDEVAKGYPEFDPDQPRGKGGRWSETGKPQGYISAAAKAPFEHGQIREEIGKTAKRYGVDPSSVKVSYGWPGWTGVGGFRAGEFNPADNTVKIWPIFVKSQSTDPQVMKGIMAHEFTHARSFQFFDSKFGKGWAAVQGNLDGLIAEKESHAITKYSADWWKRAGSASWYTANDARKEMITEAIHETLAEMSSVREQTGQLKGGPRFKRLYRLVFNPPKVREPKPPPEKKTPAKQDIPKNFPRHLLHLIRPSPTPRARAEGGKFSTPKRLASNGGQKLALSKASDWSLAPLEDRVLIARDKVDALLLKYAPNQRSETDAGQEENKRA